MRNRIGLVSIEGANVSWACFRNCFLAPQSWDHRCPRRFHGL